MWDIGKLPKMIMKHYNTLSQKLDIRFYTQYNEAKIILFEWTTFYALFAQIEHGNNIHITEQSTTKTNPSIHPFIGSDNL